MSDQYDFFATPPAATPAPPQQPPAAPVAPAGQFGAPAQPPAAPGYGTPAPGYGPPAQQFGAFGVPPQGPGIPGVPGYPGHPGRAVARPGTVTAAAVIVFVQSAFAILVGLVMLVGGAAINRVLSSDESLDGQTADLGGGLGAMIALFGFIVLAIGALFVFLGVKILGGAMWAAVTVTVFEALGLLGTLGAILDGDLGGTLVSGGLPIAVLVCLWGAKSRAFLARS